MWQVWLMPSLQERLLTVLSEVLPVEEESDGALTVHHAGTIASLRVVTISEDLDLVSLTQMVAWDLVLTKKIRDSVAEQSHSQPCWDRWRWWRRPPTGRPNVIPVRPQTSCCATTFPAMASTTRRCARWR